MQPDPTPVRRRRPCRQTRSVLLAAAVAVAALGIATLEPAHAISGFASPGNAAQAQYPTTPTTSTGAAGSAASADSSGSPPAQPPTTAPSLGTADQVPGGGSEPSSGREGDEARGTPGAGAPAAEPTAPVQLEGDGTLPYTGYVLAGVLLLGLALIAAGTALRTAARRPPAS